MRRRVLLAWVASAVGLALAACSSADDGARFDEPAERGARPADGDGGGTGPDAAPASSPDAAAALGPVRFRIQVDYRFDRAGFFADPRRKKALEGACRIWGRLLADSFANVPKGTFIRVRDPEKPSEPALSMTIDYEIDDLLVFVGSADLPAGVTGIASPTGGLSGVTDPTLQASLQQRFEGTPFQPWTAWIAFDRGTPFHFDADPERGDAVPADALDFTSVALHELGHALGFGTAEAFKSRTSGATFTGARTVAVHGGPLPLTPDLGHVPNGTRSGGQRLLMDPSDALGTRYLPTPLDMAVFEDLGLHF